MSGITFLVDERGDKTAAVINLRRHRRLWDDFYDTLVAQSRLTEPRETLTECPHWIHGERNCNEKV